MHQRFLPWLLLAAFFAAVSLHAQAPNKGVFNPQNNAGKIMVAKVSGKATKTINGVVTDLVVNMYVEQSATVNTGAGDSSVILLFSNGATTKLGADTELVIDEFLQDPFANLGTIKVKELEKEPSPSRTKISLKHGELVGDVKALLYDRGSEFTVQTPVGAAGIRGTVFRIVFRPGTNGQAFFQLTTASGRVDYTQPGQGGANNANANAQTTTATASGTAAMQVPQGQEIEILVDITTDAQGQMVVTTLPPPPSTTTNVTASTLQQVTTAAVEIATAVQNAVFTSQTSTTRGGGTGGGGTTTGSITGDTSTSTNSQTGSGGQGQNQGQGTTTTSNFQTQNAEGTVTVTTTQAQKSIPAGQITSQP